MSDKEMRELDVWLETNLPGLAGPLFWPTRSPRDAMAVFKKCLNEADLLIVYDGQGFSISEGVPDWEFNTLATEDTLELSICVAAKKLFQQQSK